MRRHSFPAQPRAQRHVISSNCQGVRVKDFRLVADRLSDLSMTGALLSPAEPVLTGEFLLVSFAMGTHWFDAEATVTRVLHGRRPFEHARALGIVFEHFFDNGRERLLRVLRSRPPVPPRYRLGRRDGSAAARLLARTSSSICRAPRLEAIEALYGFMRGQSASR